MGALKVPSLAMKTKPVPSIWRRRVSRKPSAAARLELPVVTSVKLAKHARTAGTLVL